MVTPQSPNNEVIRATSGWSGERAASGEELHATTAGGTYKTDEEDRGVMTNDPGLSCFLMGSPAPCNSAHANLDVVHRDPRLPTFTARSTGTRQSLFPRAKMHRATA
jgi:hypothetical protein